MLNKKVLAAAVVGALFAGNAAAADLSASPVVPAYFAKEIVATTAAPATLTIAAVPAAQLSWKINYNFSDNEVRYARVECSNNIKFAAGSAVVLNNSAHGDVGALNGLTTNIVTFSVTSNAAGNKIVGADTLSLAGNHQITGTDQDVTCSVGLYDQPSQAQTGGSVGLIQNTSFSGAYIKFVKSFELIADATEHTADVESNPSFSDFLADSVTTSTTADMGDATVSFQLVDPDGAGTQTAPYRLDGTAITYGDLFGAGTKITVAGDFSLTANAAAPLYSGTALTMVKLNSANANTLSASASSHNAPAFFSGQTFEVSRSGNTLIQASDYTASLIAVAAGAVYKPTDITGVKFGSIVRNGTELQAPLAQIPGGWKSRLVLTNTGSVARPYTISLLNVAGETAVTPGTLTGTVPANGTKVIDDLTTVFTGNNRATIVVNVAGPTKQIQGLYQIVNPDKGSISNHVMVRPGSN